MKNEKINFPWWYFAITCPLAGVFAIYLLVADRVWVKDWVYKTEEPYLYWFFFGCAIYGFLGAGYQGIKTYNLSRKKI